MLISRTKAVNLMGAGCFGGSDSAVFGYSQEDADAIKALFPGSDNTTIGVLLMQLDVDTNLERVHRMAKARDMTSDARQQAMIDTMLALYKNMNYKNAH